MKYTREHANHAKTFLSSAYEKLELVFESIETQEHYNVFYNMCNNILNYCKIWDARLKPKLKYIKYIEKNKWDAYESYLMHAMSIVEKLNTLIDEYTSAEAAANEYAKKYKETEERMRIEREITDKLNKEKEERIKNETKTIGFAQYSQVVNKKKRKYNKRKKDDNIG